MKKVFDLNIMELILFVIFEKNYFKSKSPYFYLLDIPALVEMIVVLKLRRVCQCQFTFSSLNYIGFKVDANNHYPVLYFVQTTVLIYSAIEFAAVRTDTMERR